MELFLKINKRASPFIREVRVSTTSSLKWLNELQYPAITAARGAVSSPLWKPLWQLIAFGFSSLNQSILIGFSKFFFPLKAGKNRQNLKIAG